MKRRMMILFMMVLVPILVMAQNTENKPRITISIDDPDLMGVPNASLVQVQREIIIKSGAGEQAFIGIYTEDLNYPKAQELGYMELYGVLITGVVPNSPAWDVRLMDDDILMEIDGKIVVNYKEFDKIRKYYRPGDEVKLKIFRSGEVQLIDFTFGQRASRTSAPDEKVRASLTVGFGGGSYLPYWIDLDMTDVNKLITDLGMKSIPDNGFVMHGGGGKGSLGKGYFIGGVGAGYTDNSQRVDPNDPTYTNKMVYSIGFGGVTLDKRFAISRTFVGSLGFMLGGGSHNLELIHSNGLYNWNDITGTMYQSNNTKLNITKSYLLVQPRAELLVRLLNWLALRGEVGYLYGYPVTDDWKVSGIGEDTFDIQNSPNTKMQSITFSVGPWFGF